MKTAHQTKIDIPSIVISAENDFIPVDIKELWRYRELLWLLTLREIKGKYRQSLLGPAWAIIQPFMTMVVFSVLFGLLLGEGRKPTVEGVPYAISTYSALVVWQLFAKGLQRAGVSLSISQAFITKVYFPRVIMPMAAIVGALVDFVLAFTVLLGMMFWFGVAPGWPILVLPLLVLYTCMVTLSLALWLSAVDAVMRDIGFALPFLIQIGMYVTPVIFASENVLGPITENAGSFAAFIYQMNPMVGVVEGFRWAILGAAPPAVTPLFAGIGVVILIMIGGLYFFRRMERIVVDVV